jgi:hypothetical protein
VDISENDLMMIYELAHNHRHHSHFKPEQIKQGVFLSNGGYGEDWSVREVTSVNEADDHMLDTIGYRVAAGKSRRETGTATRADLALWSMYEVKRMQKSWRRVST